MGNLLIDGNLPIEAKGIPLQCMFSGPSSFFETSLALGYCNIMVD